jgi:hypothetical protein
MAKRPRVRDRDRGWNAYKAGIAKAKGASVRVGVSAGVAQDQKKPGKGGQKVEEGLTIVEVAWWNEFGTRTKSGQVHVPERSFIRSTFDENRRQLQALMRRLARKIGKGMPVKTALDILGQWLVAKDQAKIRKLRTPANAPSTIARKKSSNPLIDIGQLLASITYEVNLPGIG